MTPVFLVLALAVANPFIGTWKLAPEKSKMESGGAPPGGSVLVTYSEEGDHVKVTANITLPDGTKREIVHTQTYDNKPHDRYEGKPNGETLTHRRIDASTEETTWHKDGKVTMITTRRVSEDGKTLTSTVHAPGKEEPVNVMVYERQ